MRGMVAVEKGQVRHLGSVFLLGLVLPFNNKRGTKLPPLPAVLLLYATGSGEREECIVWSIHSPFRSWNPHPSVMP